MDVKGRGGKKDTEQKTGEGGRAERRGDVSISVLLLCVCTGTTAAN